MNFAWDQEDRHDWPMGDGDVRSMNETFADVAAWGARHGIHIWLNEFGVVAKQRNDPRGKPSVLRWYSALYENAWRRRGIAMSVWDTNSDYCVYGRAGCGKCAWGCELGAHAFDDEVLEALHVREATPVHAG